MTKKKATDADIHPAPPDGSAGTREKLLLAATESFGRYGYDKTTVRAITSAAGTNVQTVDYHFGGKKGLYLATADNLAGRIKEFLREPIADAGAFLKGKPGRATALDRDTAADLLRQILRHFITVMLRPDLKPLAQFMIREQLERTDGFARIYDTTVEPLLDLCARLVAILQGNANPASKRVRLRTLSIIGSVLVFRIGYATLLRQLDKDELGPRDRVDIDNLVDDLIDSLQTREPRP